ncbi:hypothetical protein LINPERHAP1_LOCUS31736 [Linum perenne]
MVDSPSGFLEDLCPSLCNFPGTSRAPVLLPMRDSTKVCIGSPTTSLTRLKRGEAAVLDAVG